MRRAISVRRPSDERELQFDLGRLEPGDRVEVFVDRERQWLPGIFQVATDGEAWIELPRREAVAFTRALAMGLKRVLH